MSRRIYHSDDGKEPKEKREGGVGHGKRKEGEGYQR